MKSLTNNFVSNRVLKLNVGFLLNDGPAHSHDSVFDVPAVRVADDLDLLYIRGPIRMSRTKEGILLQGKLRVGIEDECIRCLDPVTTEITIEIEELFTHLSPHSSEFVIHDDAILDLAPLIRAEVLIAGARGLLCREDCKGLCPECGANFNRETCDCQLDAIDPRMAKLKELLDRE
ncbi:MAG: DUF177 domain-containing protein [Anaerolineae bacterium]|nr:DUF177 domain-containing protein [Anaerolineae bacterium]